MILCPGCGADMRFDPARQKLFCEYCDTELDPKEYHSSTANVSEQEGFFEATVFTCPQCGAEVISTDETAATFCSYCGTSVLLESRVTKEKKPDIIIPFKRTKEESGTAYKNLIKKALFAPTDMQKDEEIDKFRGIYMPYWVYSVNSDDDLVVKGTVTKREGDYLVKSNYKLKSPVKASYKGIAYDASANFYDNLSNGIAPFHPETQGLDFDPAYLSGFYADVGDVDNKVYRDKVKEYAIDDIVSQVTSKFNYGSYEVDRTAIAGALHVDDDVRSGLFPVWFLANRAKGSKRISYAVVNGETGKVSAEIPIDFKKYLIGSLILAVPLFLLFNLLLTLTPGRMLFASLILAIVSLIMLNTHINRVYTRENYLDDAGFQSVAKKKRLRDNVTEPTEAVKAQYKEVSNKGFLKVLKIISQIGLWFINLAVTTLIFAMLVSLFDMDVTDVVAIIWIAVYVISTIVLTKKVGQWFDGKMGISKETVAVAPSKKKAALIKPIIAIVISAIVMISSPALDYYYYGAALLSMVLIVWSFFDLIKQHNLLTTRKLPHLGKRGGDENA